MPTKKYWVHLMMLLCGFTVHSQTSLSDPDIILRKGEKQANVLLVGSFHFAYYGLDAHKTSEENKLDILSELKQKEIDELVDYIAQFKPNKLVVEGGRNTGYLMQRYRAYKSGKPMRANEIDQICFRLMDRFAIDTLYGCDAAGLNYDLHNHQDSAVLRPYLDELFEEWDFRDDGKWSNRYTELYEAGDKLAKKSSILEYFQQLNDEKQIRRRHGAYLSGDFELGEFRGVDALTIYWYSRNLRIYRNIQRITTSPDDRIMVLFGAGHLSILKQQFESTPAYDLIPFNSLMN